MKLFSFLKTAFHVYLYKGSHTDTKIYKGLINSIEKNTNKTCQVTPYNFFKRNKFPNDTIIIGHSFGGYFSLLDYYANKDNIKGIVLLNSHFNSMGKAWYPKIQQGEIEIPVLTILGGRDTRLPLTTSLWDYYEKKEYCKNGDAIRGFL
jgi:pimeloyl-ACP methyl ester carboxylesterase